MQNQLKKFETFFAEGTNQSSFIRYREMINAVYHELNDCGKYTAECPVRILPEDNGDDGIFICPDGKKPVACNFSRGWAAKTLYIFFLRHPEGVYLVDMEERRYTEELARIYKRLKFCQDEEAWQRAKNITKNKSMLISDIKNWFEARFAGQLASKYAIAPRDNRRSIRLYGINISQSLVDLGRFGFNFQDAYFYTAKIA